MKRFNRWMLLICVILIGVFFTMVPASAAAGKKLVKEYTYKQYIKKNGAWKSNENTGVKHHKDIFKYNKKGDPEKITTKEYLKSGKTKSSSVKIKYTFKKGKKTKRKVYSKITEYKKGVPVSTLIDSEDGYGRSFRYKFKSRYGTEVVFRDIDPNVEEEDINTITMTFKVKTSNGLPVKITGNAPGGFPVTMTFYTTGAKKGLVKKVIYDDTRTMSDGQVEVDKRVFKYTYTVKKGQIVKSVRTCSWFFGYTTLDGDKYSDEGLEKTEYKTEFKFKYTAKKTDNKRSCAMLNDIVANLEQDDAYGRPVLYTYWY